MSRRYQEDDLQMQVAQYCDLKRLLWAHPANERKTSPQAGARLKRKGVKSGVPDVMIYTPNQVYAGLAIELKTGRNKPTDKQQQWLDDLSMSGWQTAVCYTFDAAKAEIDNYMRDM